MSKWIIHNDALYNLDKFTQIIRGDETEILLCDLSYNGCWDNEENNICVLEFKDKETRELSFDKIKMVLFS